MFPVSSLWLQSRASLNLTGRYVCERTPMCVQMMDHWYARVLWMFFLCVYFFLLYCDMNNKCCNWGKKNLCTVQVHVDMLVLKCVYLCVFVCACVLSLLSELQCPCHYNFLAGSCGRRP